MNFLNEKTITVDKAANMSIVKTHQNFILVPKNVMKLYFDDNK